MYTSDLPTAEITVFGRLLRSDVTVTPSNLMRRTETVRRERWFDQTLMHSPTYTLTAGKTYLAVFRSIRTSLYRLRGIAVDLLRVRRKLLMNVLPPMADSFSQID